MTQIDIRLADDEAHSADGLLGRVLMSMIQAAELEGERILQEKVPARPPIDAAQVAAWAEECSAAETRLRLAAKRLAAAMQSVSPLAAVGASAPSTSDADVGPQPLAVAPGLTTELLSDEAWPFSLGDTAVDENSPPRTWRVALEVLLAGAAVVAAVFVAMLLVA